MALRASPEGEIIGMDIEDIGEAAFDFTFHRREVDGSYLSDPCSSTLLNKC